MLDDLRSGARGLQVLAFDSLRRRYGARLLAYARRLARGDAELAVDLVQDTWVELLEDLDHQRVVLRNADAGGLLATMLRRRAARRFRRTSEDLVDCVDDHPAPERDLVRALDESALLRKLAEAPEATPILHAVLIEHRDVDEVREDWCRTTGCGRSAFYKSRQREAELLRP